MDEDQRLKPNGLQKKEEMAQRRTRSEEVLINEKKARESQPRKTAHTTSTATESKRVILGQKHAGKL